MPTGTHTIFFVPFDKVAKESKISYIKLVATIRPNQIEVNQVRLTDGGGRLEYSGVTSTDKASLTTTKICLNSVVATPNVRFMTAKIKYFYYGTPLDRYKYLRKNIALIPEKIYNNVACNE